MYKVLISGMGSRVGQSIFAALNQSKNNFHIIAANSTPDASVLYQCPKSYMLPPFSDRVAYQDFLTSIIQKEAPDIIIPSINSELEVMAEKASEWELKYQTKLLISPRDILLECTDKYLCGQNLHPWGFLSTAQTEKAIQDLISQEGFPLVVKPRWGAGSDQVQVVFSRAELSLAMTKVTEPIVQVFVIPYEWGIPRCDIKMEHVIRNGKLRQDEEYSLQIVINPAGKTMGVFTLKCVYQFGQPIKLEPIQVPVLEQQGLKLAQYLSQRGFRGPLNLQARQARPNMYLFYDLNPRFTAATSARTDLGFCDAEALTLAFLGHEDNLDLLSPDYQQYIMRSFTNDLIPYHQSEQFKNELFILNQG